MVVALDGSPASETVLDAAGDFARTMGATLHLVRVKAKNAFQVLTMRPELAFPVPEDDPQPYLNAIADTLAKKGVLTLAQAREGEAADEIVALARDVGAGLICLTTHGHSGLARKLLGSVAESVLRNAPCPVLLRRAVAVPAPHESLPSKSEVDRPPRER